MGKELTVTCPHCNYTKPAGVWLAAHWNERVVGTCEACGKMFGVCRGITSKKH